MEKLTLKELAPYLPYGLKFSTEDFEIYTLESLSETGVLFKESGSAINGARYWNDYFDLKPVLRPLSDLTKEIEHNGERFVPLKKLAIIANGITFDREDLEFVVEDFTAICKKAIPQHPGLRPEEQPQGFSFFEIDLDFFGFDSGVCTENEYHYNVVNDPHVILEKLYEWHFDIKNLIPKNLAIDKNTIEPVK